MVRQNTHGLLNATVTLTDKQSVLGSPNKAIKSHGSTHRKFSTGSLLCGVAFFPAFLVEVRICFAWATLVFIIPCVCERVRVCAFMCV